MKSPEQSIRETESSAARFETPCGAGSMAWRRWGEGPPLLLLHGGAGSWMHWLPTIPALAGRFTVWAPDLPGMGESEMPPEPISFDAYCDIVSDGIASLLPAGGALDVAGFSFGASIAVRLASRLPVRHMVLSGANYVPMTSRPRRNLFSLRRIADPEERNRALEHNLKTMMIAHPENVDALALRLYDIDTRRRRLPRPAINNLGVIVGELPGARLLGRMCAVSGADDQVVTGGASAQAAALAALRPGAAYHALPGGGHWVMYEVAQAYNQALLARFLMDAGALDVVVIGAGLAGMAAANRCAELGLKVAVLEKSAERDYPCNTRYSNGAINCAFQDVNSDPAELVRAIEQKTCGHAVPALALAYARNAAAAVRWLREQGVQLEKVGDNPADTSMLMPQGAPAPGPAWQGRGPDVAIRRLNERLIERGGKLFLGTRANALVMEGARCAGVIAERGGESVRIAARESILADGGFQSNPELIRRYITPHPEAVHQRNSGSGSGDALRMALAAGARAVEMQWFYGHVLSRDAMKNDLLWPNLTLDALICQGIAVDAQARRFVDESHGGVPVTNAIARLDDPLSAFAVFDQALWETVGRSGRLPPNPLLESLGGTVHRGDSLEALAALAGLPSAALARTVEAFNREGRRPAMRSAPFYALPVCAGISYTLGGVLIDDRCRVVREDGTAIDGLRAAGSVTGGNDGGPLAGQTGGLGKSLTFGWHAANCIARELRG